MEAFHLSQLIVYFVQTMVAHVIIIVVVIIRDCIPDYNFLKWWNFLGKDLWIRVSIQSYPLL